LKNLLNFLQTKLEKYFKYFLLILFLSTQSLFAQFYYFGRNKVQYEKFDWKILKTEHFDIYYYDEMLDIAEIGATYAEEIYEELKRSEEHTSELQSRENLVCRLLLEKKKKNKITR